MLQACKANLQRKHHFFVRLCRTVKKMPEEAAYQSLKPARPVLFIINEGLAAFHCIPKITFDGLRRRENLDMALQCPFFSRPAKNTRSFLRRSYSISDFFLCRKKDEDNTAQFRPDMGGAFLSLYHMRKARLTAGKSSLFPFASGDKRHSSSYDLICAVFS